jgi:hypothetical protein
MFANLIQLITGRPPAAEPYELAFVKDVHVRQRRARRPKVERLLLVCWVLIALKSWLVIWAVAKYHVPIHPLWVIVPTVLFALLCTLVYLLRDS